MNLERCFEEGLLRKATLPGDAVDKEIANARRHLDNARRCIDAGMDDLAVVSAYTAMFHAARALLYKDGIKERSHVCVVAYLRERYPKLADHANILDGYRKGRHTVLYGIDEEDSSEDARQGAESAAKFIKAIEETLGA